MTMEAVRRPTQTINEPVTDTTREWADGLRTGALFEFAGTNKLRLRFIHPEHWTIVVAEDEFQSATIQMHSHGDNEFLGRIELVVRRREESEPPGHLSEALLSDFASGLRESGGRFSGAPISPCAIPAGLERANTFSTIASRNNAIIDTRVMTAESSKYAVLLLAVGDRQRNSSDELAINQRTFEIVRDSLRIGDDIAKSDESGKQAASEAPQPSTRLETARRSASFPNAGRVR